MGAEAKRTTVADIMSTDVLTLCPGTSLRTAMAALEYHGVSGAPVVNELGNCAGVFSLANVARAGSYFSGEAPAEAYAAPFVRRYVGSLDEETVGDWMSTDLKLIAPTATAEAAARLMVKDGVHRLLVLDGSSIVGVVSSLDIARIFAGLARAEEPEPALANASPVRPRTEGA